MAPEADGGVLDPELKVHGIKGLRVVDASSFPNVTSANTNAPTMMLAWRAAEMILKAGEIDNG
jgi:choline dehydrogenase